MRRLTFLSLFFGVSQVFGQTKTPTPRPLEMSFDSKSEITEVWSDIAQEAKKVRVFIGGENHNEVTFNSLMEYGFMNRLHKYAGYRHYLLELSPARGYYLNRYVRYADTHARDALKGISSPKYMNLFENLYRWNQALDSSERIWIHGIDVERFDDLSMQRLADVFARNREIHSVPRVIAPLVFAVEAKTHQKFRERLARFNSRLTNQEDIEEDLENEVSEERYFTVLYDQKLIDSLNFHLSHFKQWLGADYPEFLAAFEGVKEGVKWDDLSQSATRFHWREGVMYERLKQLLDSFPQGKFFGQFGRCHVSKSKSDVDCGWFLYESVVSQLIKYYFKNSDSVITVGYFYGNRNFEATAELPENQEKLESELKQLTALYREGISVFDLKEPGIELQELQKKYRYILVNNAKNVDLAEEMPDKSFVEDNNDELELEVYMPLMGIAYWKLHTQALENHASKFGANYRARPLIGAQHQINFKYGKTLFGLSGYYTFDENKNSDLAVLSDSGGNVFYGHYGVDLLCGWQWRRGLFQWDIMGRLGFSNAHLTYTQSVDRFNSGAAFNGIGISNLSWNSGIQTSIYYKFNEVMALGVQGNWHQNIGNGTWFYRETNVPYANLGTNSSMTGWSLSLNWCVFFGS